MAEITLKNINKLYPSGVLAVNDFSLDIKSGEFLVLVGPSGCGKSTVLRLISGLEKPTSGEIFFDGIDSSTLPLDKRGTAMVFQNYALFPQMTVRQNLAFGLKKVDKDDANSRVEEAAALLHLTDCLGRKPKSLSGGQKQRVALGRALVCSPKFFLLDEPLSNLDAKLRSQTRAEIITLHERLGATFVYVTHDQTEAMTMGSRIAVMDGGVLQQAGTPAEIFARPKNKFVAGFLGSPQINFLPARFCADAGQVFAQVLGQKLPLHPSIAGLVPTEYLDGREICIGVRPEHIVLVGGASDSGISGTSGTVSLVEELGSESHIYIKIDGESVVVREKTTHGTKRGDTVGVQFDTSNLLFFDNDTQKNIFVF